MPSPERILPPSAERANKRAAIKRPKVVEEAQPTFDEQLEAVGYDEERKKLEGSMAANDLEAAEAKDAGARAPFEKLAAANVNDLPRNMKELRASLMIALPADETRGMSDAQRMAAGLRRLQEKTPKRAERLQEELTSFDFEAPIGPSKEFVGQLTNELTAKEKQENPLESWRGKTVQFKRTSGKIQEGSVRGIPSDKNGDFLITWNENGKVVGKRISAEEVIELNTKETFEIPASRAEKQTHDRIVIPEQEAQASQEIESLRKKIEAGSSGKSPDRAFDDLSARTRQQLSLAESLRTEFLDKTRSGKMSDADMNRYDNQLMKFRTQLENLQAETRVVPAADKKQLESLRSRIFETIQQLEEASRIAELPAGDASYEAKYSGVRQREVEMEQAGTKAGNVADQLAENIQTKYGADPETLMSGGGMKGLWFRMKNSFSHIAGQESEYDKWNKAKTEQEAGETARLHRTAHERKGEHDNGLARREENRKAMEASNAEKSRIKAEAQRAEREWVSKTLGRERAMGLHDEITERMNLMKSENPDGYAFTAEGYVTNLAHLSEAMQQSLKSEIKEYAKTLQEWNKELGYPVEYNPLLGSGASRLKQTRAIGGNGRARAELAQETNRVTGGTSRREAAPRIKVGEHYEIVTPAEHQATKVAVEAAPYETLLHELREDMPKTSELVPNAAELWNHFSKAMRDKSVEWNTRAKQMGTRTVVLTDERIREDAANLVLNLAAFKKATEDGNIKAAQKYQDAAAAIAFNHQLQNDPSLVAAYNLEFPAPKEPEAPKGSRTMGTKPSLETRARQGQRTQKQNQRSRF